MRLSVHERPFDWEHDASLDAPARLDHSSNVQYCDARLLWLRLGGVESAADLLVDAPADWPGLSLEWSEGVSGGPVADLVTSDRAEVRLRTGGWIAVERAPARAVYHLPAARTAGELVHPYLAPAAALVARWLVATPSTPAP